MEKSYKCPKCGKFIIGTYCFTCKKDIHDLEKEKSNTLKFFEDFFNNLTPED